MPSRKSSASFKGTAGSFKRKGRKGSTKRSSRRYSKQNPAALTGKGKRHVGKTVRSARKRGGRKSRRRGGKLGYR